MNHRLSRQSKLLALAASTAVTAVATSASAYFEGDERWTQRTAYVVRPKEAEVGLLNADVGLAQGVQVGTDTLPWVAGLFMPVVIPNAHVEVNPLANAPTSFAVRGAVYYANVKQEEGGHANIFIVPTSVFGSIQATPELGIHLEGQYTFLTGTGTAPADNLSVAGGAAASSLQFGLMATYRLGRVVSLYGRGRWQPWARGAKVTGNTQPDAYTNVQAEANVKTTYASGAWQAIAGVQMSWAWLNAQAGVGYGDAFLPAFGVVVPYKGVLPDADLFVRF